MRADVVRINAMKIDINETDINEKDCVKAALSAKCLISNQFIEENFSSSLITSNDDDDRRYKESIIWVLN